MPIPRRQFLQNCSALAAGIATVSFTNPSHAAETTKPTMLTRAIPSSGEKLPVIGLGTFRGMMTNDLNEETLAPLAEVLKSFYEAGGRVVDTAPSYGNAEEVIGILTPRLGLNEKFFFATKVLERGGGEAAGIKSYERSLQRLKRDKLELMQVHNFI